jgi:hypothetical protein
LLPNGIRHSPPHHTCQRFATGRVGLARRPQVSSAPSAPGSNHARRRSGNTSERRECTIQGQRVLLGVHRAMATRIRRLYMTVVPPDLPAHESWLSRLLPGGARPPEWSGSTSGRLTSPSDDSRFLFATGRGHPPVCPVHGQQSPPDLSTDLSQYASGRVRERGRPLVSTLVVWNLYVTILRNIHAWGWGGMHNHTRF